MAKKKILLIDDDILLSKMYKSMLDLEGYDTTVADGAQQGLELIKKSKPDLLILDMMMPGMSGLEFLEIMQKDAHLKTIPTLMLSNQSDPKKIKKAQKLGVKEFIFKVDYVPSQIVKKMKKYLKN